MKIFTVLALLLAAICVFFFEGNARSSPVQHTPDASPQAPTSNRFPSKLQGVVPPSDSSRRGANRRPTSLRTTPRSEYAPLSPFRIELRPETSAGTSGKPLTAETYDAELFQPIPAGTYAITVSGEGWEVSHGSVKVLENAPNAVEIQVSPSRWLAGFVTEAATAKPVSDFTARIEHKRMLSRGITEKGLFSPIVFQSAVGRFAVGGIPAVGEQIRVHIEAAGFEDANSTWFPLDSWEDGIEIQLSHESEGLALVTGRVLEEATGAPIQGAQVLMVDEHIALESVLVMNGSPQVQSSFLIPENAGTSRGRAVTDSEGRFELPSRYSGSARILVHHPDFATLLSEPVSWSPMEPHTVEDLVLAGGSTLEGKVWTAPDARDQADITMVSLAGHGAAIHTDVREDGTFRFAGLAAGNYMVAALAQVPTASGFQLRMVKSTHVQVDGTGPAWLDLHYGSGLEGTNLTGQVLLPDPSQEPDVEQQSVALVNDRLEPVGMASIDAQGSFTLPDVPPGAYMLLGIWRNSDFSRVGVQYARVHVDGDSAPEAHLDLGQPRVEVSRPGHAFEEIHLTAKTDDPLFDDWVQRFMKAQLDGEGRLVLYGLPAGTYRLFAPREELEFEVPPTGGEPVRIRL